MTATGKRRTPAETLRAWCGYCIQSTRRAEIENCGGYLVYATGRPCHFYAYRLGGKRVPARVFKTFCTECQGSALHARECPQASCPLFPFRHGRNPNIRGASRERMAAIKPPGAGFPHAKTRQDQRSLPGLIEDKGTQGIDAQK